MRTLIDGYNLMYAAGLLGRRLGPDGFRKVRHRFLNDLAAKLDPVEAHQTTVVFDAASHPEALPKETTHKGLTVVFAVDDDDADTRIEWLIAHHSTPKALTVVSSDRRIRQAAARRKARALSAEEFLDALARPRGSRSPRPPAPLSDREREKAHGLSAEEAEYWRREFRDLEEDPPTREALRSDPGALTDEEIAQIEREVEREF